MLSDNGRKNYLKAFTSMVLYRTLALIFSDAHALVACAEESNLQITFSKTVCQNGMRMSISKKIKII
jgi:hypothetical protein